MKKIILLSVFLVSKIISPAQGVYQFWGMTALGGSGGYGVIYSTDDAANNFKVRYNFKYEPLGNDNGSFPTSNLIQYGGKLYAVTQNGGRINGGVIFEYDLATNVYTKRSDFSDSNGTAPASSLTRYGSRFYGMAQHGGSNNMGVIFEWDPATNLFKKKFDFGGAVGAKPLSTMTLAGDKFYGTTIGGGAQGFGVIFEWDPVTNVYTKKIDLDGINGSGPSDLVLSNGKFYGMTTYGGSNNIGVIFEWDLATNTYTKKIDFTGINGSYPMGFLSPLNGKFYGMTFNGGSNTMGVIFEWDPASNVFKKKIDFDGDNGIAPAGSLTLNKGKFYGTASGDFDPGSLFEWDPITNIIIKKRIFKNPDGYLVVSDLTLVQMPAANGLPGSCIRFPSVTIDNSNNNKWVSITDTLGNAVAEIKANGNNLGAVTASMYINNSSVRGDANKKLYLDRNITLTPQVQPTSLVDIRLYIKGSEFLALKNAFNSNGDSSGIRSINDMVVYKNESDCLPIVSVLTDTLSTKAEGWEADYVFTVNTSSFSSFYFAGRLLPCPGPVIQCKADTVVNSTDHHCGALVNFTPPVVTDACGTSTITQISGLPSGAFFPVGVTTNTFVASGSSGKNDTCNFTVTVKDTKPPFITPVWAPPSALWPPNHKMKKVPVNYYAWDNCGPVSCSLDVTSDEPVTGTGYGDKAPDWVIVNNHHVLLRAERAGHGNGRTYTITVTCTDSSGNTSTRNTKVFVPHHLHERNAKGKYNFGADNDGYIDPNGDYFDDLLVCKVLPNPSNQYFNLEIESASNEKIEVNLYDISGRFISKLNAVKNQTYRFGGDLRPGMYMVEVRQGQQRNTIKVVKQ